MSHACVLARLGWAASHDPLSRARPGQVAATLSISPPLDRIQSGALSSGYNIFEMYIRDVYSIIHGARPLQGIRGMQGLKGALGAQPLVPDITLHSKCQYILETSKRPRIQKFRLWHALEPEP